MREQEQQSRRIIADYMGRVIADAGLLTDLVALTGAQLQMLAEVSAACGVPFDEARGKLLIASLLGNVVPCNLSFGSRDSLTKSLVPGDAPAMTLFCGASTWALGMVFLSHFKRGGTLASFDSAGVREPFQQEFDIGCGLAADFETTGCAR